MKDALGLLFIIGMIALGVWFYAGDAIAAKTGLPISRSNIADSVTSFDDTTIEVANQPDPSQRHLDLKQHMLELTNQERMKNGVPTVRMGNNPAAQLHAEAALEGCYSAHWDRWGLKPNQRYTLTGGIGADGENVSGLSYCIKAQDNYEANSPMATEIAETGPRMDGKPRAPKNPF